jgi:GxxExxY protein
LAEIKYTDLTGKIIGAFYTVYNSLGYGFLEKVYENALALELRKQGFAVGQQQAITAYYDGQPIGQYFADLVVNDVIIVELKAVHLLLEEHEAQLLKLACCLISARSQNSNGKRMITLAKVRCVGPG